MTKSKCYGQRVNHN